MLRIQNHAEDILFASVVGSRMYGFASPNSDYDVRGAHVLPLEQVLGFSDAGETIQSKTTYRDCDVDVVTHDIRKYFRLLMKGNGNILEDVFAPEVLVSSDYRLPLKDLARGCITKSSVNHYRGMATQMLGRMDKEEPSVKAYLHLFRLYMTAIHLMRTGEVQVHLPTMNSLHRAYHLSSVDVLLRRRANADDDGKLTSRDADTCKREFGLLAIELDGAVEHTSLADKPAPGVVEELERFMIEIRLELAQKGVDK